MKKILTIILFLISLQGFSQVKQTYNQYGGLWNRLSLKWNGGFQLPRSPVSTKDLNVAAIDTAQVYYNPVDSSVYYHTGSQWIKFITNPGYTTLSQFVDETAWRTFYSNGSGDITPLAFGTSGKVLTSNGVSAAPTWETPSTATPTLQQVVDAGNTLANNDIKVGTAVGPATISMDSDGDGSTVKLYNTGNTDITVFESINNKSMLLDVSLISNSTTRTIKFPDANITVAGIDNLNLWSDGVKQTFNPNGTNAGLNAGSHTGDPSSLANGDIWYNSTSNELKARINGSSVALGAGGGGSGTVTSVSFTDDDFFDGTVANPTTTPAISIVTKNALFNPFDIITNFGYSDEVLIRQSSFGAGSTIGTLSVTTIFDGWMFGQYMETGTTTTGSAYNYGYASGLVGGIAISNSFRYNAGGLVRIPVLSDGTDTYNYMLGFADDAGNGVSSIVDGIYFEYSHALNSGNWTFTTESNGTKTQTDTGIPVVVNTDYKLNVSVYNGNAFGYIDNVLVATNTTNIPTGTARATGFANSLAKTAGTTNVKAFVEYLGWGKRAN